MYIKCITFVVNINQNSCTMHVGDGTLLCNHAHVCINEFCFINIPSIKIIEEYITDLPTHTELVLRFMKDYLQQK